MNMMQSVARKREKDEISQMEGKDLDSSPVKTVLGTLAKGQHTREPTNKQLMRSKIVPRKPYRIEDVPFRRQDRRILNAMNRRLMDRKLIVCIVLAGILLFLLGTLSIVLYFLFREELHVQPLIIIGPVLLSGSIITWLCSIEVCIRLSISKRRAEDPELDNLVNPHEVKHWMDPKLIPYGWGLYVEEEPKNTGQPVSVEDYGGLLQKEDEDSSLGSHVALQLDDMNLEDYPHRYGMDLGIANPVLN